MFPLFFPLREVQNVFDVALHALCAGLLHLVRDVTVDIQRESGGGVTQVALNGFDVVTASDGCDGIRMPKVVEAKNPNDSQKSTELQKHNTMESHISRDPV